MEKNVICIYNKSHLNLKKHNYVRQLFLKDLNTLANLSKHKTYLVTYIFRLRSHRCVTGQLYR